MGDQSLLPNRSDLARRDPRFHTGEIRRIESTYEGHLAQIPSWGRKPCSLTTAKAPCVLQRVFACPRATVLRIITL